MSRIGRYNPRWTPALLDKAVHYLATIPRENPDCETARCIAMADFNRCALSVLHSELAGRTLRDRLLAAGRIERLIGRGRASCYRLVVWVALVALHVDWDAVTDLLL